MIAEKRSGLGLQRLGELAADEAGKPGDAGSQKKKAAGLRNWAWGGAGRERECLAP